MKIKKKKQDINQQRLYNIHYLLGKIDGKMEVVSLLMKLYE